MNARPPLPPQGDLRGWASRITHYVAELARYTSPATPKTIQLEHKTADAQSIEDGIMMWDPVAGTIVVSKNGTWKEVTLAP